MDEGDPTLQTSPPISYFNKLTFSLHGLNEDRYRVDARVLGDTDQLRWLAARLNGQELEKFIGDGARDKDRQEIDVAFSALWHLSVDSPDRPGILATVSNAVAEMFGTFVWMHADTTDDNGPRFQITAVVAFNKIILPGAIANNVRRGFDLADDREKSDKSRRGRYAVSLADGNVAAHPLRR